MLVVLGALGLGACSRLTDDDKGRSADVYCGQVQLHLETLNAPDIDSAADVTQTIEIYRAITEAAPAAVEPEWQQLLANLETASTVDPEDPASLQLVADTARTSRPAATRVQQYTDQVCALKIADPPPVTNPVTATTAPPGPNTSAPPSTGEGGG